MSANPQPEPWTRVVSSDEVGGGGAGWVHGAAPSGEGGDFGGFGAAASPALTGLTMDGRLSPLRTDSFGRLSPIRTGSALRTSSGVVRGQEVSAHVRLRAPPQPGVTDATKMMAATPTSRTVRLPESDSTIRLSGVPHPRRSLVAGDVRLASTRMNGHPCKTMSVADSLAGSLSDDIKWRSRPTKSGDCVKNAADMLPRRSRLTQMILSGPQRSPAMCQIIANDAALANPQRRVAPAARPISSQSRRR